MAIQQNTKRKRPSINVSYREDGVYLVVENPEPQHTISPADVAWVISQNAIVNVDHNAVNELCSKKLPFIEVKISSTSVVDDVNETIKLKVTDDKMQVHAKFTPPKGKGEKLTHAQVMEELAQIKVSFGVREDIIKRLVANKNYVKTYIIAIGEAPEHGIDGGIDFLVDVEGSMRKPKITEDGKADFRNLDLFKCTKKGDVLCTLIEPVEGKDGVNVFGTPIKHRKAKKAPRPPVGKNVIFDEESKSIIADMDGQIIYAAGKVNIFPILEIDGDVGNATGNVEFTGSVSIKGNVLTGFKVIASGNVDIGGVIEGAYVQSGGDINCANGIQGLDKAEVLAMGNVIAKYVRNCTLEAGGNIVTSTIMHSKIKCYGKVDVGVDKGIIAGGTLDVLESIEAKIIGSKMATATKITVGIFSEMLDEYNGYILEMNELKAEYKKIVYAIQKVEEASKSNVKPEIKALLQKYEIAKQDVLTKLSQIKDNVETLEPTIKRKGSQVRIIDVIHPGVVVNINSDALIIKDSIRHSRLYNNGGRVVVGQL